MVRGEDVVEALEYFKVQPKGSFRSIGEIVDYQQFTTGKQKMKMQMCGDAELVVKEISVDVARMLKRLRPAPQGRAHRIRKRSNHVTVVGRIFFLFCVHDLGAGRNLFNIVPLSTLISLTINCACSTSASSFFVSS